MQTYEMGFNRENFLGKVQKRIYQHTYQQFGVLGDFGPKGRR